MLDGIWQVYKADGTYLGMFKTRIGNDVLILDQATADKVSLGEILHMDETHTKRAWEVRIKGNAGKPSEFLIEKLSDRAERYPDKPVLIQVTTYK